MTEALRFRWVGRAWHACLDTGEDLAGILALDDALWAATAAPIVTLRADPTFLACLDSERDGRIRADDVRTAIRFLLANLAGTGDIRAGNTTLRFAALAPDATHMLAAGQLVLAGSEVSDADSVSLEAVRAFIEHAAPSAPVLAELRELERLVLYQAWMVPFVNSFVGCRDLYQPAVGPMFGWGALVLDGRWFRLAVKVADPERHEIFTRRGALCVMYVEVCEHDGARDYEVAIPVTAGMRGQIVEGTWGMFIEHDGRERHARVRKLVINPISFRDAIVAPFRRISELFRRALDKADAAQAAGQRGRAMGTLAGLGSPATLAPSPAPVSPASPAATVGGVAVFAGAGVAVAALGSALTYVSDRFLAASASVGGWITHLPLLEGLQGSDAPAFGNAAYPIAVAFVLGCTLAVPVVVYLLPVCIAAWINLRSRDLGSLLIGSGWSVNTRMYVTRDVAGVFTHQPSVPRALRGARARRST